MNENKNKYIQLTVPHTTLRISKGTLTKNSSKLKWLSKENEHDTIRNYSHAQGSKHSGEVAKDRVKDALR